MTNWFEGCATVSDIKTMYRDLAMGNHPDRGGNTAVMQRINAAYQTALQRMDGSFYVGTDDEEHKYRYDSKVEKKVAEKVQELFKFQLAEYIDVRLIGTWVWVTGTRRDDQYTKEILHTCNFKYHSKRTRDSGVGTWYWRPKDTFSRYNPDASLDSLQFVYGGGSLQQEKEEQEQVA